MRYFNEGKFESSSESDAKNAKLLILVDELACVDIHADVCYQDFSLAYEVSLPELKIVPISIEQIGYPPNQGDSLMVRLSLGEDFFWNQSDTKAVYKTPCPAGCPDQIFEAFSLGERTATPLVNASDGYDLRWMYEDIEWVSDNEIKIGTSTFSL